MGLEFDGVNGIIKNTTSDGDVTIKGNDGGSEISLLTFDVSAEGVATFNKTIGINTTASTRMLNVENTIANGGGTIGLTTSDSSTSGIFGTLHFGNNTDSSLASIGGFADGATDAGALIFKTEATGGAIEERVRFSSSGAVFNEGSFDMDFRVESNGNANMLFVDGGENRTGIGTGSPQAQFDVTVPNAKTANAGVWGYLGKTNEGSGYGALQCFQVGHANAASRQWQFQTIEQGVANDGIITLQLSGGNVAIGRSTADAKLDVSGGIRTSSGILFGTDTAAANTLDDYEEGEYTYTITGSTSGSLSARSGYTKGHYTKIGNWVKVDLRYETDADNSLSGNVYWSLPFTMAAPTDQADAAVAPGYIRDNSMGTNARSGYYFLSEGNAFVYLLFSREGTVNSTLEVANDGDTDGVMEGCISISYRTT